MVVVVEARVGLRVRRALSRATAEMLPVEEPALSTISSLGRNDISKDKDGTALKESARSARSSSRVSPNRGLARRKPLKGVLSA